MFNFNFFSNFKFFPNFKVFSKFQIFSNFKFVQISIFLKFQFFSNFNFSQISIFPKFQFFSNFNFSQISISFPKFYVSVGSVAALLVIMQFLNVILMRLQWPCRYSAQEEVRSTIMHIVWIWNLICIYLMNCIMYIN